MKRTCLACVRIVGCIYRRLDSLLVYAVIALLSLLLVVYVKSLSYFNRRWWVSHSVLS